jgi:branched-chain amino acid transport system ATP-binding protein
MLEVSGLSLAYGRHQALHAITFGLQVGEAIAILGANGAGKTSLLNAIAGLVRPSAGSIRFQGTELVGLASNRIVELGIATVPENRHLFGPLSVIENLTLGGAECSARSGVGEPRLSALARQDRRRRRRRDLGA